ncbi:MAG: TrkH family potassium uptake protein [Wujia sp.]
MQNIQEYLQSHKKVKKGMSNTTKIMVGFLLAILIGAGFLSLPIATVSGKTDYLTSLFTATTSVCVTGLVVVPTFSYWSLFGKIVILILIQLGGLGIVTLNTIILLMIYKRATLKDNLMIQDAFGLNTMRDLSRFVKKVIIGTLVVELLGACLYMIEFVPKYGAKGVWYAIFNGVSAFCNAGIDILGEDSLMSFSSSPLIILTSSLLIILGGIGFVVWWDVLDVAGRAKRGEIHKRDFARNLTTHTKIVLSTTAVLLLFGTVMTFVLEYHNPETIGNMSLGDKIMNSWFQSVTYRTAGFATINQAGLTEASVVVADMIMLIGGSPVGTAGGIKTVTAAVIFFSILAVVKGNDETIAFRKRIPKDLMRRSLAVMMISVLTIAFFMILLMVSNDLSLADGSYEVVSAMATVGLTRDVTPTLNVFGRICIIICMYLGRIGPITMFIFFGNKSGNKNSIHYAKANITVG